jgi:hypothetical protein
MKKQNANRNDPEMDDREYLIQMARQRESSILGFYGLFVGKNPVMLLELPEDKIYAYPYLEFKNSLSERSQKILEEEYQEALAHKLIVVFVKDNERRKMISFSIDAE